MGNDWGWVLSLRAGRACVCCATLLAAVHNDRRVIGSLYSFELDQLTIAAPPPAAAVDILMNAAHFWIPTIIRSMLGQPVPASAGASGAAASEAAQLHAVVVASLLAALPFALAGVCMVGNAYSTKRHNERRLHTAVPLAVAGVAFGWVCGGAHGGHLGATWGPS